MIDAAVTAKAALGMLAMMVVQGTVLALIALVIVRGWRMRPAWQAAVWLVVLVKFVLPWGPSLPWSLADVIASLRGETQGGSIVFVAPSAPAIDAAPSASLAWLALAVAWAAGTAFVLARAALAYHRTHCAARHAAPALASAQDLFLELAARVGVRGARLVVGDPAIGPHVIGVLHPIIVIPPALAAADDPSLVRAVLLHELAHVRRRDALGRVVQLIALALFWFWPVVRLASRRLELARESACDAWALEAGDISRPAYARLLLQMAQLRTSAPAPALATPHGLGDRVAGVLGPPVRPRLGMVHRLALIAWIGVSLGGARSADASEQAGVCIYTSELAEALRRAHPEADVDGNGVLSHEEACEFQAEVARRVVENEQVSVRGEPLDDATAELLSEPLCCNCDAAEGLSGPATLMMDSSRLCQRVTQSEGAE